MHHLFAHHFLALWNTWLVCMALTIVALHRALRVRPCP
jgi:hypothetical protein